MNNLQTPEADTWTDALTRVQTELRVADLKQWIDENTGLALLGAVGLGLLVGHLIGGSDEEAESVAAGTKSSAVAPVLHRARTTWQNGRGPDLMQSVVQSAKKAVLGVVTKKIDDVAQRLLK